jgi:hypothetical protein
VQYEHVTDIVVRLTLSVIINVEVETPMKMIILAEKRELQHNVN